MKHRRLAGAFAFVVLTMASIRPIHAQYTVASIVDRANNHIASDGAGNLFTTGTDGNLYWYNAAEPSADGLPPVLQTVGQIPLGDAPNALTVAPDAGFVYVGLNDSRSIARFNMTSGLVDQTFFLGTNTKPNYDPTYLAGQIVVVPGAPNSIAVRRTSSGNITQNIALFDDGIQRPQITSDQFQPDFIQFGADATTLWAVSQNLSPVFYSTYKIGVNGFSDPFGNRFPDPLPPSGLSFQYVNGLLYLSDGQIFDPVSRQYVGSFAPGFDTFGPRLLVDAARGRIYFLSHRDIDSTTNTAKWLRVHDLMTQALIGEYHLIDGEDIALDFVQLGPDLFAFNTFARGQDGHPRVIMFAGPGALSATAPEPSSTALFALALALVALVCRRK